MRKLGDTDNTIQGIMVLFLRTLFKQAQEHPTDAP